VVTGGLLILFSLLFLIYALACADLALRGTGLRKSATALTAKNVLAGIIKPERRYRLSIAPEGIFEVTTQCKSNEGFEFVERVEVKAGWEAVTKIDAARGLLFIRLGKNGDFVVSKTAFPDDRAAEQFLRRCEEYRQAATHSANVAQKAVEQGIRKLGNDAGRL
jgi:hypothetical protein